MDDHKPELLIKRWELDAVVIEIIVLSGVATGVAVGFLSHLQSLKSVPFYVLNGAGFGFLGLLLIPAQSILVRVHRQHQISPIRSAVWCVVCAFLYVVVVRLLQ
jgi:drug/metabolite transporter (DMT)-like permease